MTIALTVPFLGLGEGNEAEGVCISVHLCASCASISKRHICCRSLYLISSPDGRTPELQTVQSLSDILPFFILFLK